MLLLLPLLKAAEPGRCARDFGNPEAPDFLTSGMPLPGVFAPNSRGWFENSFCCLDLIFLADELELRDAVLLCLANIG